MCTQCTRFFFVCRHYQLSNFSLFFLSQTNKINLIFFVDKFIFMFVFKKWYYLQLGLELGVSVFNITFNNISVISWQSVFLVEETRVPRINHRLVASNLQKLSHINVASSKPRQERDSNSQHKWWWALITLVIYNCDGHWLHRLFTTVMGTDYTGYLQLWWELITQVIYYTGYLQLV